jgi:hypothetical protein
MPEQFWKVKWEPKVPETRTEVHMHFCATCGCIGPCECWIKRELERMATLEGQDGK